MDDFLAVGW